MRTASSTISAVALAIVALPILAQAQDAAPPVTIWNRLGIPQGTQRIRDSLTNRRGNFPGLERKDPLKRIADPANLESENPAIKAAAEIKKAEDEKKQKIKALKFLAEIGCGCYNKDGKITDALLAALSDCTEDVRYEAIQALEEASDGKICAQCKTNCCTPEIGKKLAELAYGQDEKGCYLEPSERVREAAEEMLAICPPIEEVKPQAVIDDERPTPRPPETPDAPEAPQGSPEAGDSVTQRLMKPWKVVRPGQLQSAQPADPPLPARQVTSSRPKATRVRPTAHRTNSVSGVIRMVDPRDRTAHLQIDKGVRLPVGTRLKVEHAYLFGPAQVGTLKVLRSTPGAAIAASVDEGGLARMASGDRVSYGKANSAPDENWGQRFTKAITAKFVGGEQTEQR